MSEKFLAWRPVYEVYAAAGWAGSMILSGGMAATTSAPSLPIWFIAGTSGVMFGLRGKKAWNLLCRKLALRGKGLTFITPEELLTLQREAEDSVWLGTGFEWTPEHSQRAYDMLKVDQRDILPPAWFCNFHAKVTGHPLPPANAKGIAWLHGLEPQEVPIWVSLNSLEGHTQILGTTGCGKTRLLEIFLTQAIHRGDVVIVIDPKNDKDLRRRAKIESERAGRAEQYFYFGTAFPSESCRFDPLANFSRVTQLASRISALVASEAVGDSFAAFSWSAVNKLSQGLVYIDERPSLMKIRRLIEGGPEALLQRVLEAHFIRVVPDIWEDETEPLVNALKKDKKTAYPELVAYLQYYKTQIADRHPSEECGGLISLFEHNREHFGKMIATLSPVLDMLTSGDLGKMLSPDAFDLDDPRPITNSQRIINGDGVFFLGLDALSDKTVASAIGSMVLSDFAATAGAIYNYGRVPKRVTIIVDEANEVLVEPFIQILNKGRGAGFQAIMATQTTADYAARLGSADKALQVMGNCNNVITMRVIDPATQEFVLQKIFGQAWIKSMQTSYNSISSTEQAMMHFTGGVQNRLQETLEDAIPQEFLGRLPNWEYFASFSGGPPIKARVPIIQG